jgi:predicted O-linked N-acetylglucosamine transferase (SPINDLY family)
MEIIADLLAQGWKWQRAGEAARAEQLARQVLELDAYRSEGRYLLGASLHARGRLEEAVEQYEQVLRHRPAWDQVLNDLGTARAMQGRLEEAVDAFGRVLQLNPASAQAHANLGNALRLRDCFAQALPHLEQALQLRPLDANTHFHRGLTLAALGRPDEAVACHEQAVRIDPRHVAALTILGNALCRLGFVDEGMACHRQALAVCPEGTGIYSNLLYAMHHRADYDPQAIFAEHVRWGERFLTPPAPQPTDRDPHRRLRIGYVSGDFRHHVLGNYIEGVLAAHDHNHFEIFCYANVSRPDAVTERIRGLADCWRSIHGLPDTPAADQVRQDHIDLLIDLSGHTAANRLGVFALRPAPVQVTHFGYHCTTGLAAMDYRLTDAWGDPPGQTEGLHVEKLLYLPNTQWCYRPFTDARVSPERAGTEDLTFGSLNKLAKVTEERIGHWAEILGAIPKARMLVLTGVGRRGNERVSKAFGRRGIDLDRVTFVERQSASAYYQTYRQIDICLDTYPSTGLFTTADALWMGVPVVTQAGPAWHSRQGVALLAQAGLLDLVTETPRAYVDAAIRLARDRPRRQELREKLRDRLERSPLMDVNGFTRKLETAYRILWERCCRTGTGQTAGKTP